MRFPVVVKFPSFHTPPISTHDGRRAWAFLAIVGGCMVFTAQILVLTYLLRGEPGFLFWIAMAAHIQVFIGMGAIGWAMGRRMVSSVSKDGASFDDRPAGDE